MNKVVFDDCINYLKNIESNSVDLTILDPPYFKVINEKWDNCFKTESEYIEWCKTWLNEVYRVTRIGGTIYLFGYFRILVHLINYIENLGFELRQQIIIDKGIKSVAGRSTKNYKMFLNVTESILFFIKDNKQFIKPFLKDKQEKLNLTSKFINESLNLKTNGGGMWSIYTGENICEQFPTKEIWQKLEQVLQFNLPYEKIAQTFNIEFGITDVWKDINFYDKDRIHPTQKPLKLINRLICSSSNENDLVLDIFGGSGTTAISSILNKRNYIIIEKDEIYYKNIIERINQVNKKLF